MSSPLDRLDELLAAATPGPWHYTGLQPVAPTNREWPSVGAYPYGYTAGAAVVATTDPPYKGQDGKADAELIVWLVNHAAGLARIARALPVVLEELDDAIKANVNSEWSQEDYFRWDAARTLGEEALAGLGAASEDNA